MWSADSNSSDPQRKMQLLLEEGIATLDISVRTANALERAGIMTVSDLLHTYR